MPYISVQLSSEITPQQAKQLSHGITEIMGSILNKKTALTAVNISYAEKNTGA